MWLSVMLANFRIVGSSKDSNGFKKNSCIPLNFLRFFFSFQYCVVFFLRKSLLEVHVDSLWILYKFCLIQFVNCIKKKKRKKPLNSFQIDISFVISQFIEKLEKVPWNMCWYDMIWYLDLDLISRRKWKKKYIKYLWF